MSERLFSSTEQTPPRGLERVLGVLEAFGDRPVWGVRALANRLGLPPSTVHATLKTLSASGLLEREADGHYRLSWRAVLLARALEQGFEPAAVLRPFLVELAERSGETAHLAVRSGGEVVYLDKVEGRYAVRLASRVGARYPAYSTAAGKALLAQLQDPLAVLPARLSPITSKTITDAQRLLQELEEVRRSGFAVDRGEMEEDAACVGIAVQVPQGVYAFSLSGPRERVLSHVDKLAGLLREVKARVEERAWVRK